ncbi:phenylalanine--tRNA ligase subunit beta [uncultured Pseudokineococcus sp.]|uniref:phenylalanine--tRNA ligase subunit beta n=1 Tax=uncultured Pseudokineococcus sp. TaxID=1642928 RepID=UPI00263856F7|nr:phenylalanine--tRNA ligase subunit beta [uncultured Pseudokineococcus sp.]
MRVGVSWLAEVTDVADGATAEDVAAVLVRVGLEEEGLHGGDVSGPVVVGRVLSAEPEPQKNGKTIHWCSVDVGEEEPRGIVCGAQNFGAGDLVVVSLPGAVLPGGFAIAARKTYGHVSDGMICSTAELGLGEDSDGIVVLGELLGAAADGAAPGDDATALLGLDDRVVEVNVTPDRGYCLSVRGLGREHAHGRGLDVATAFRDPLAGVRVPSGPGERDVVLADEGPLDGRPGASRFTARTVRGVDPSRPTPWWLRRRLVQAGMRPVSLAVDVTNYVMLLVGQPLHAYDAARLDGALVVRRARAGERLTTLDGVERALHPEDLVVADGAEGARAVGLAGVMGGASTEVTAATRDVVLEAACFDPVSVARTARRHRLPSEASRRFERGVDDAMAAAASQLAVDLLVEHGGGTAEDGLTDVGGPAERPVVALPVGEPARLVGVDYAPERVRALLEQVGCAVSGGPGAPDALAGAAAAGAGVGAWSVEPPSWRPDLRQAADLVEEVARLDGYDRIPSVLPRAVPGTAGGVLAGGGLTARRRAVRSLARALAEAGLVEVASYPFVSPERADALGLPDGDERRRALRVANPLREEEPLLRTSLLATLVDVLRRNVGRGADDVALFELGSVALPAADRAPSPRPGVDRRPTAEEEAAVRASVPHQPLHVAALLVGARTPRDWEGRGRSADARDAVELALLVGEVLGVPLTAAAEADRPPFHPGRCAALRVAGGPAAGAVVGHAGELAPRAVAALEVPARTVALELDLDVLLGALPGPPRPGALATYPVVKQDVALVVDASVPAADVEEALRRGAGLLLEDCRLVDVYAGEQVGEGRRSLAFSLRFRAPDRTLTGAEVAQAREAAVAAAGEATGAVLRGS